MTLDLTGTANSEVGALQSLWLRHPREAFVSQAHVDQQWEALRYSGPPDRALAIQEFDALIGLLRESGASIEFLPASSDLSIDSIYIRDASVVTDNGIILCRMGKSERSAEPESVRRHARKAGVKVLGAIEGNGRLEGGDFVWLRPGVAAVGRGYRTNAEGIRQLETLLRGSIDELIVVPLPHWKGSGDVFHLMSIISPIDDDLAVVYSPLMPVPFRERLLELDIALVEVPYEEFDSMGANVLATGPRRALMLDGNPITRARLEAAGADVTTYAGNEISAKGCGGPTCLTRPMVRAR